MYYSNGNYEAFADAKKPAGVDKKSAYIIGSGLAGLSAAVFLVRDAQMKGENIHILEELPVAGGSLDGAKRPNAGFVVRGGREMENHFECLWDMYRSIPSLEIPGASYLDEYYWLDKEDPNSSNCRLIYNRGDRLPSNGQYGLGKCANEILKLIMTPEKELQGETIEEFFSDDFFKTNFWTYWATMFAFEKWHSAAEMRRYAMRFIHHIDGLPDFTALKFNKYNQYESMVKPLLAYLKDHGVQFEYDCHVDNVVVDHEGKQKVAKKIVMTKNGEQSDIDLTPDDIVFVTNGSITESSTYGDQNTPAPITHDKGSSWKLWENLAKQDPDFGHPDVFCENLPERSWFVSATATLENKKIAPYFERLTKRSLYDGKVNTGGIITVVDSNWELSFTIHRQPHFKSQNPDQIVVWIYALYSDTEGNYIKKRVVDCTGKEIAEEMLYHLGVPESQISELASEENMNTVPVYMPYITSYFMPRHDGDRPDVVPEGSVNIAFIGNFAESPTRDTVFTTEYSVRTAMEAVYTLLNVDRGVPEVFDSIYDIRQLLRAMYYMSDKKKLVDQEMPLPEKLALKTGMKKIKRTWVEELLEEANLV
ncbi:oleate hydratase [Lactobacillus crispatus]|uniref:Oleate hydratase n=1 Tax=Lactobacillus crispatus TaxID=47770 RepID=A0A5M9Z5C2_9LACO|nr:oleate hydratase [Lactobacillus crispatus]KAA8804735.1 oleate hydratase [Lactobacillus crispatus]KAA8813199.1 oleate hydratase [Lactobacillus crispatus]KRK35171.1 myosin-crossreactive antigen [Lactobacillus crispatus DSM 20584 = JCM 1185 = ATCC 33820]MBW9142750.1 oleate hydratase [Lactobacillus crispatus]ORE85756.1 oleate hydratase [Lactobacillus crispatus]